MNIIDRLEKENAALMTEIVCRAKSGHIGAPLGMNALFSYLSVQLRFPPTPQAWREKESFLFRDNLILSAGHASIALYTLLYRLNYLSMDDLLSFRQLDSKTPGHPERQDGIEVTTGPLGQGLAMGVGFAYAKKKFREQHALDNNDLGKVIVIVSDGDLMEGLSHESCSLAGSWDLDNLIIIFDNNNVCLDGPTNESIKHGHTNRFREYGFKIISNVDGNNFSEIDKSFKIAYTSSQPVFLELNTTIGIGLPKQGTSSVHGTPPTELEVTTLKQMLELNTKNKFFVSKETQKFFEEEIKHHSSKYELWKKKFDWMSEKVFEEPCRRIEYNGIDQKYFEQALSTRDAYHVVLNHIAKQMPILIVGSADLSSSDKNFLRENTDMNIKFGVREAGMGAIANGISISELFTPVCSTFLSFSKYMLHTIEHGSLMNNKVIWVFSHDSFMVGEDGATHHPINELAMLRSIPGLTVIRPAGIQEMIGALHYAHYYDGPVAIITSRQAIQPIKELSIIPMLNGGYTIKENLINKKPDWCIVATGSEVSLACEVYEILNQKNISVKVVSLPSMEIFRQRRLSYRKYCLSGKRFCVIEAGSRYGWHEFVGNNEKNIFITQDTYSKSAPGEILATHFGFTAKQIVEKMLK